MRMKIVSPPRVGGLHELNPAGRVDTEMKENENRFALLHNETEDSPSAKAARLKPVYHAKVLLYKGIISPVYITVYIEVLFFSILFCRLASNTVDGVISIRMEILSLGMVA